MKSKNMSTEQIQFLLKMRLINSQICSNLEKKGWSIKKGYVEAKKGRLMSCFIGFLIVGIYVVTALIHSPTGFKLVLMILYSALFWLIWELRFTAFEEKINHLQKAYNHLNPNRPYCLHKDWDQLQKDAVEVLKTLGDDLERLENSVGITSKMTNDARLDFKNSHAIYVEAGLCEKDQRLYIPSKKKAM